HAPMLSKELSLVDWTKPAQQVHDLIRGLNPWPSAVSYLDGKKLKLHASRVREGSGQPGKAFVQEGALLVCCGQGALELTELQTENGKRMDGKSYLLGHPWNRIPALEGRKMLEIQPGRFVLKSRESLHGRELDVVVDSLTGVNYVTYLASSSAPLSPLLDKDGKPLTDTLPIETP
ncbi:MAG: DUF6440 family protein, partial [Acutalibacter sp.]